MRNPVICNGLSPKAPLLEKGLNRQADYYQRGYPILRTQTQYPRQTILLRISRHFSIFYLVRALCSSGPFVLPIHPRHIHSYESSGSFVGGNPLKKHTLRIANRTLRIANCELHFANCELRISLSYLLLRIHHRANSGPSPSHLRAISKPSPSLCKLKV